MILFGIDFVPLNVPLKSRMEAIAAGILLVLILGLLPIGILCSLYVLVYTKYWWIVCAYFFWVCVIDKDISEEGGRLSEWVRSWMLFKYVQNYFPITVKGVPGFKIDPQRNYISCSFPHGIMPIGIIIAFLTNASKENKMLFPHHYLQGLTLKSNFWVPIYREFLLALGMCSASAKSIKWLLNHPGGGRIAGLIVGGAEESFYCETGHYRVILKNRKGFVKLALKNGAPIIPSFAFGQNDTFKQVMFAENSIPRHIQNWIKRVTGIAPVIFYGRGLLQYTFGYIPLQKPINIVVGHPIEVNKIENPTQEDIDAVHSTFIEKLTELFDKYKYEYESNPDKSRLTIC